MYKIIVVALVWFLVASPAWALDFVRIATIPKGHIQFQEGIPIGDADHDGRREFYFEQSISPFSLNIWEHWGSNSFQPVMIKDGCHPTAVGDSDQDGLSDLLCAWGPRTFLLESMTPTSFPSQTVWEEPLGGFPGIRGYIVDTDQDGRQEMWIIPNDPDQIEVWENQGDNTYVEAAILSDPRLNPTTLAFGDFDGDGKTETIAGAPEGLLFAWENAGDNSWALTWTYEFPLNWTSGVVVTAHDMDGDGRPEFIVGGTILDTFEHVVTIFEATGDNTYSPVWELRGAGHVFDTYIAVGDIDGDGIEEFAVAIPGKVQIYKAFGDNDFRLISEVPYPDDHAIAIADLNGNGVDELIINGQVDKFGTPTQIYIYELADIQPPVLIPAFFPSAYQGMPGDRASVHVELYNRTDAIQKLDVWAEIYKGDGEGGPKGSFIKQSRLFNHASFQPKTTITRDISVNMPSQPGSYTVQLKIGTFPLSVVDTRWFTVKVDVK